MQFRQPSTDFLPDGVGMVFGKVVIAMPQIDDSRQPATLAVTATDTGQRWWAQIGSDAPQIGRGPSPVPADTEVRACSGELLLLLWNRRHADGLTVQGRADVLDTWAREAHL